MGKPVVAFAVGGVVEMLDGQTGELVAFEAGLRRRGRRGREPARDRRASPTPSSGTRATRRCGRDRAAPARERVAARLRRPRHARRIQREIVAAGLTSPLSPHRRASHERRRRRRGDRVPPAARGRQDRRRERAAPVLVLFLALCALAGTWFFALQVLLNPHTDLRELLPSDSPGLKAFEHQLGRVGGGATLIVVAESPDKAANERFVDDLAARLDAMAAEQKSRGRAAARRRTSRAARRTCARSSRTTSGSTPTQKDLESAYDTLDFQIAVRSGLVTDLDDDDARRTRRASRRGRGAPQARRRPASERQKPALGLDEYRDRWKAKAREHDDFPSGYFETADGKMIALRIVSFTTGMGDAAGDRLLGRVGRLVQDMTPAVVPARDEGRVRGRHRERRRREGLDRQRRPPGRSRLSFVAIAAGVVWFFRSFWSLVVIALPALLGVGAAYAFAYFRFGYVNTTGMFLGAIILGNGINYPIVLLSRYREFRARGQEPADARREAVQNALRAELVGACVASIAYGSLTVTDFRGFNQFGWIGFVGMLLVWISMIPCVPALLVVIEWLQSKLPPLLRDPAAAHPAGRRPRAALARRRAGDRAGAVGLRRRGGCC